MKDPYPIQFLDWDTQFFGMKMGMIDLIKTPISHFSESHWKIIMTEARRQGYLFLFCQTDSASQNEANILIKSGAIIGDVLVTFYLDFTKTSIETIHNDEFRIEEAIENDLPQMQEIAANSFSTSRFYLDSRFDKLKASQLYRNWLNESYQREKIFVLKSGSEILGFISFYLDDHDKTASIRLLATKSNIRSRGLGKILISHLATFVFGLGFQGIKVGTQIHNYGAIRFYEKIGFRFLNAKYRFHLWLD